MKNPSGKLNEKEQAEADRNHASREEMPDSAFLDEASRKYPVKSKQDGEWKYSRDLLLAAEREANMHGHSALAERAKAIREREFGGHASDSIAMDKSMRTFDSDGRLHVAKSHISKAAINPYYGKEIPGWEQLGLDPGKIYQLLRDPEELKKAATTFAGVPILKEHPDSVDEHKPELVIGSVGSNVSFNDPYLDADLVFWTAQAIAEIESDAIKELSCAYRYVPVMEPGTFRGKPYDGRMTQIEGNHVAKVEDGRAGSDVVVADQDPFQKQSKEYTMKMTKLGKALYAALSATSKKLAQDAALGAIVGNAAKKTFVKEDVKKQLLALDATLNPQQLDNIIDALLDVEQNPDPTSAAAPVEEGEGDEEAADPRERLKKVLAGKVDDETLNAALDCFPNHAASDEDKDEKDDEKDAVKKEDMEKAMDAMSKKMRQEFKEAAEAARDVRHVVGDVFGMDSAAAIYGFALDHMKVDRKDVKDLAALRALFRVASDRKESAPAIAQDSAKLEEMFPDAARFGRA